MTLPAWFLKQKGLQTTRRYQDMQDAAHARAFTVVKIAQLDALAQIKKALLKAIEGGQSFSDFKAQGTHGLKQWHLKTVYQTNLQAAFMAGRHAAALEATETHPYWLYLAEMDAYTRPSHAALHGKAFRHDDPIWNNITPPNGYNCRCRFIALSEDGLKEWGVTPQQGKASMQADKGFNSSPMAAHTIDKLLYERATLHLGNEQGRDFIQSALTHPARMKGWEAFVESALDPKHKGQRQAMAFALLPADDMAFIKQQGADLQNGLVFLEERQFAGDKWARHKAAGNAPTVQEFREMPQLFTQATAQGAVTLWDSADKFLIYLIPTGDTKGRFYKIPIRFNRNQYGGMAIEDATTVFKISEPDIKAMLKSPEVQKIR